MEEKQGKITYIKHWTDRIEEGKIKITNVKTVLTLMKVQDPECEILFRGENKGYIKDGDTRLLPSAFRGVDERKYYYDAVTNFSEEFARLSSISKLAKMQHYNYPTRLLDLTTNPLVALWFACSDYSRYRKTTQKKEREDGFLYLILTKTKNFLTCDSDRALLLACLSKLNDEQHEKEQLQKLLECNIAFNKKCKLNDNEIKIDRDFINIIKGDKKKHPEILSYSNDTIWDMLVKKQSKENLLNTITEGVDYKKSASIFEKFIGEAHRERFAFSEYRTDPRDILSTFIVRPMIENERQRKQEGLFAIFGINSKEYNNSKDFKITSYLVPKNKKKPILEQLDKLGINEATLFGDMESRVSYIRNQEELLREERLKKEKGLKE